MTANEVQQSTFMNSYHDQLECGLYKKSVMRMITVILYNVTKTDLSEPKPKQILT